MQLVAVDESPAGDIADDGVILPAVPEPAHDIDEFGDQLLLRIKREIFNLLYSEKQRKPGVGDL